MNYGDADANIGRTVRARGYTLPIIFDIGGSNGSWVNVMSKVFPESRFELFEPLAEIHPDYKKILVHLNEIHKEAYMHPVAIGQSDGQTTMNIYDDPSASTTIPVGSFSKSNQVTVPVRSIDSIVTSKMCKSPDLIKMDIQGAELDALLGARETLPQVKFLMLETWIQRSYGKHTPLLYELMEFLTPLGFAPYDFGHVFRDSAAEAVAVDVWFINKRKANNPAMY